jgi:hypothetical protein
MNKTFGAAIALLVVALPTSALDIYVDYDRWGRFSAYRTIAWAETEETSMLDSSQIMHERVKSIIMTQITQGRLSEVEENPDLYITYHTNTKDALQIHTDTWGYGFPGSWHWDPYWNRMGYPPTTTVRSYKQGTLVIDIWDANEKTLIWRGTAVGTVSDSPDKNARTIEKAIKKMIKKWNKMKPGF